MNDTLPRMILGQARRLDQHTALRHKHQGKYQDISWARLDETIRLFARGLLALKLQPGQRVAIVAPNGPDWVYTDVATMACGAVSVPVYHTSGITAIRHIVEDSQCQVIFVHSPLVAEQIIAHRKSMPHLHQVVLLEGRTDLPEVLDREAFLAGADPVAAAEVASRLAAGRGSDLASLVYTSGTTGLPKGVMLTHDNFLSNIRACVELFQLDEKDQCLSFLPLSHVFERMAGYYLMLYCGTVIAYAESFDTIPTNLAEIRPTIAISVPRLYEKMYARIMERVLSGPWLRKQVFFGALRLSRSVVTRELAGQPPQWLLKRLAELAKKTIFAKLREHLGGRLRFFVSGGAPLSKEIAEFFLAAGIPIYEGYGLTETAPVIAANYPGHLRPGTVGQPIPGTEVRIAGDGEILVRGPGVFQGYWNQPEATAEAFVDGWFMTGDIGELDRDGYLAITDRKKDLIVTAGGENISPQFLENLLKTDKFIANAMVYGDRKPYLTALLVPNLENLENLARNRHIDFLDACDLVNHPDSLELIRDRLNQLQGNLPPFQRIKRFTLLSADFSRDEVTPTLKLKRERITKHFHQLLEGMYLATDHGIHDSAFCVVEELTEEEK
jgi:long-chain acyl-CoA synthetase